MNDRRRSMRRAADPCLGFYLSPTPLDPPAPPSTRPPSAPPVEVLQDPPDLDEDNPEEQLTVDAFLRRSVVKTYRKKRSRRNERDVAPLDAEFDETSDAPRTRQRQPKRSLKKRIVKAAVQTHGDPDETLLEEQSVSHTRTPLPFVEDPHLPIRKKRRTWSLVDPKRALATRSNAFPSRDNGPGGDEPKRDTLSGWHATIVYPDGSVISKRKARGKGGKAAKESFAYPPLSFVALEEAERSYALMRMPHKVPADPVITKSARTRLDLLPSSPAVPTEHASLQSPDTPLSADQQAPFAAPTPHPVNPPAPTIPPSPPVENDCDVPNVSQKTSLKPLGSFFDQFLRTARSETQLQNEKNVPRKVPPTSHANRSKASFLRSAIRPAAEFQQSALSCTRLTYAPDTSTFQFPAPITTPFFVPSSPHTLQPTQYQVVLPSTPSTSRRPMSFAGTESSLFSFNNRLLNPRVCECFHFRRYFVANLDRIVRGLRCCENVCTSVNSCRISNGKVADD